MTRNDFELIARTLRGLKPASEARADFHTAWIASVQAFATMAEGTNPGFNRSRFYTACGMQSS